MKFNLVYTFSLFTSLLFLSGICSGQTKPNEDSSRVVVLVRLTTEYKRIARLEAGGLFNDAAEIREKVHAENNLTIEAFRYGLTCCQYRFFYDTSSRAISYGVFDGVFVSPTGQSVAADFPENAVLYIAEFGSPRSETFGTESGYGLVIYDKEFNQMKKPFPYHISTIYGLISRKEAVARFDRKLTLYLSRGGL